LGRFLPAKTISKNRKDLLDYERDKKMHLSKILCNKHYTGLNKEPLTGTEILEIWQKLIKSRGLFMKKNLQNIFNKQETFESDEDDHDNTD
jgi:hypothetical protein